MSVPTTQNVSAQNAITAKYEQEERDYLSRIVSLDVEMRETIGLTYEVSQALFEKIQDFIEQPIDAQNSDVLLGAIKTKFAEIKSANLEDYRGLVKVRETVVQNGRELPLNAESRGKLVADFEARIDKEIQQATNGICLQKLEEFQKDLKKKVQTQGILYEYALSQKTELTEKVFKIAQQYAQPNTKEDLWTACEKGGLDTVREMIQKEPFWSRSTLVKKVSKEGHPPLNLAVAQNHEAIVRLLLEHDADPNSPDALGYCSLHWAAVTGNCFIIGKLLDNKALVNAKGEYQRTPLHMAVWHGKKYAVEMLLLQKADINAQTVDLITSLHTAVEKVNGEILAVLLKNDNLNVNLADSKGFTPLYYAIALGLSDFASLIIGHKSWKKTTDPQNPNHIDQLAKIKPTSNADKIENFFKVWR